jgi:hypothetical protein
MDEQLELIVAVSYVLSCLDWLVAWTSISCPCID